MRGAAARRVAAVLLALAWFGGPLTARGQSAAPVDSIQAIHSPLPPDERYPPRAVGKGATVGLITGALTGIGFGILVSLYANAEDDDGFGVGEGVVLSGVVGLLGAGAGVAVGAWAGSLFTRQSKDGQPRGTRPVASLAVSGGYADFTNDVYYAYEYPYGYVPSEKSGGFLGRVTLYSHFEPWLAVGAEAGFMTTEPHSWRLAGGVRLDPFRPTLVARPYLAGSLGGNFWDGGESLISGDAGIGVEHPLSGGLSAVGIEGRYHWNLQNAVEPGTYNYTSLALTWRHDW